MDVVILVRLFFFLCRIHFFSLTYVWHPIINCLGSDQLSLQSDKISLGRRNGL